MESGTTFSKDLLETQPSLGASSVLVTGAAGFIGSHLVRRLVQDGAQVCGVTRRSPPAGVNGVRWSTGDISDLAFVSTLLKATRPDVVFHLASRVVGVRDLSQVVPTLQDNLVSTVNLLSAATELSGIRLVLAGSLEEREAGSLAPPSSPYAAAKGAAKDYAQMFHRLYGTPVGLARIFMVYGPEQKDLRKLVPYVTLALLRGETPEISSGTRRVDWIYVDDVVNGLISLARSSCTDGKPVDLGTGDLTTVREVVERLVKTVNPQVRPRFGAKPDRPDEQVRCADRNGSRDRIGWSPKVSLQDGLERTVHWYADAWKAGRLDVALP
jgi:nucleoside-diphosphate-sugar epimerase